MLKIDNNEEMLSEFEKFTKDCKKTIHSRKNPSESSVATLALGEATGHHHSIDVMHDENKDVEVTKYANTFRWRRSDLGLGEVPDYFKITEDATIKHQEHESITLPSGIYRVRIVKEYDPFSNTTRGVAD